MGLRQQKKLRTRTVIADVATRLFMKHGFDQVTMAEIARASRVSTMTVFNYFPRKEDLFFDRDGDTLKMLEEAFKQRRKDQVPVNVLHRVAIGLTAKIEKLPTTTAAYCEAIVQSPCLQARARELRDHATENVAETLAASVGKLHSDQEARLIATLYVAVLQASLLEGVSLLKRGTSLPKIKQTVRKLLDRALPSVWSAADGTPYGRKRSEQK